MAMWQHTFGVYVWRSVCLSLLTWSMSWRHIES